MCFNVFPFVKYFRSIYYYEILPDKYFQDRNTKAVYYYHTNSFFWNFKDVNYISVYYQLPST